MLENLFESRILAVDESFQNRFAIVIIEGGLLVALFEVGFEVGHAEAKAVRSSLILVKLVFVEFIGLAKGADQIAFEEIPISHLVVVETLDDVCSSITAEEIGDRNCDQFLVLDVGAFAENFHVTEPSFDRHGRVVLRRLDSVVRLDGSILL